jgi:hypothetical protein
MEWPSVVHTQSGAVYACEGRFTIIELDGWYYVQERDECGRVVSRSNGMSLDLASQELVRRVVGACLPPLNESDPVIVSKTLGVGSLRVLDVIEMRGHLFVEGVFVEGV